MFLPSVMPVTKIGNYRKTFSSHSRYNPLLKPQLSSIYLELIRFFIDREVRAIWHWFKTILPISFQFHHTQMDGAHAAKFLSDLHNEIYRLA